MYDNWIQNNAAQVLQLYLKLHPEKMSDFVSNFNSLSRQTEELMTKDQNKEFYQFGQLKLYSKCQKILQITSKLSILRKSNISPLKHMLTENSTDPFLEKLNGLNYTLLVELYKGPVFQNKPQEYSLILDILLSSLTQYSNIDSLTHIPLFFDFIKNIVKLLELKDTFIPNLQYTLNILDSVIIFYKFEQIYTPDCELVQFKFNTELQYLSQLTSELERDTIPILPSIVTRVYDTGFSKASEIGSECVERFKNEFKVILEKFGMLVFYIENKKVRNSFIQGVKQSGKCKIRGTFDLEYFKNLKKFAFHNANKMKLFDIRNQIFGFNLAELNLKPMEELISQLAFEDKDGKLSKFLFNSLQLNEPDLLPISLQDVYLAKNATILQIGASYIQIFNKYGQFCYKFIHQGEPFSEKSSRKDEITNFLVS